MNLGKSPSITVPSIPSSSSTINPSRENPLMALSLSRQRQLAPTVGPATSGVEIRAEALGGIGDTMVVGRIVYFGGTPFIAV